MVSHGLDVGFHAVLDAVHWVVEGCNEKLGGRDVVPTLDFLVSEAGMPVSAQVCTVFGLKGPTDRPTDRLTDRLTYRPIDRPTEQDKLVTFITSYKYPAARVLNYIDLWSTNHSM